MGYPHLSKINQLPRRFGIALLPAGNFERVRNFMKNINANIGKVIRARRAALGVSQEIIGKRVGVTFQQIQKYENGTNGLTVERLFQVVEALEWNVIAFIGAIDSVPSSSTDGTRQTLEIMKRINMLNETEFAALTSFLNILCRGRNESNG
jgi:transcriptional regulator with XRE-family HTH domain